MDKLSFEILSYIGQAAPPVLEKDIYELYGDESQESLHSLETSGHIKSGKRASPYHPDCLMSDGRYTITSTGREVLELEEQRIQEQAQKMAEEKAEKRKDRCFQLLNSLFSAAAGALLTLSVEHFPAILDFLKSLFH